MLEFEVAEASATAAADASNIANAIARYARPGRKEP
jgi:hypothetical protein